MHRPGAASVVAALGVLAGNACKSELPQPAVIVWDSAGVEVVENAHPVWREGDGFEVGRRPVLRIGMVQGQPAYEFTSIVGAVRLEDGSVVVADAGVQEVRFFDPDGNHTRTVGGRGAGPGEFTALVGLGPAPGGGLWVWDTMLRRLVWLNGAGEIEKLETLGVEPVGLMAVGALRDRSMVLQELVSIRAGMDAAEPGRRRDPIAFVRYRGTTESLDTIGLFPGREMYWGEIAGVFGPSTPLFPRSTLGAVRNDRIVIGTMDTWMLREYGPTGVLERIVRLPSEDLSVGSADVVAHIDARVAAVEPDRRQDYRSRLEAMPAPSTRAAHGYFLVDWTGHVWVRESFGTGGQVVRWTVIDPSGRWLGDIDLPLRFDPTDIGEDWVFGIERDTLDVHYAVMYPLDRQR